MRSLSVRQHKFIDPPFYALPGSNPKYAAIISCAAKGITVVASLPKTFSFNLPSTYSGTYLDRIPGSDVIGTFNGTYGVFGGSFNTKALTSQVWQGSEPWQFDLELHFIFENDIETNVHKPVSDLMQLCLPEEKEDGDLLGAPGPYLDFKLLYKALKNSVESAAPAAKAAVTSGKNAAESVVSNPVNTYNGLKSAGAGLVAAPVATVENAAKKSWGEGEAATKGAFKHVSRAIDQATINSISLTLGEHWYFPSVVITNIGLESKTLPTRYGLMKIMVATVSFSTFYVPTSRDIERMYSPARIWG